MLCGCQCLPHTGSGSLGWAQAGWPLAHLRVHLPLVSLVNAHPLLCTGLSHEPQGFRPRVEASGDITRVGLASWDGLLSSPPTWQLADPYMPSGLLPSYAP